MRLLVADDDASLLLMIKAFLESAGHEVATATNGQEAFELLQNGDYRIIITDLEMPEMDGLELCRRVRSRQGGSYVYVILLTSHDSKEATVRGLDAGADDYLTKPFEPEELEARLRTAERIVNLESMDLVVFSLARLAESRDNETGAHLERIREYSRVLAEHMSHQGPYADQIDADFVRLIYMTSPLHDIGKVGIPDAILLKPERLTKAEFEVMKQHAEIGRQTLEDALQAHPHADFLREARDIAWCHHEKFDGNGYPRGLKGEEIPLSARIVALCDVYDALTSKRQYKEAFTHEVSTQIILEGSGAHFDPVIVEAFRTIETRFHAIRQQFSDTDDSSSTQIPAIDSLSTEPLTTSV